MNQPEWKEPTIEEKLERATDIAVRRGDDLIAVTDLCDELIDALETAKETIKAWHNLGAPGSSKVWDIYNSHSPEMKKINRAIERAKGQSCPA